MEDNIRYSSIAFASLPNLTSICGAVFPRTWVLSSLLHLSIAHIFVACVLD